MAISDDEKQVSFLIKKSLHEEFMKCCKRADIKASQQMRTLIRMYVEHSNKEKP